MKRLHILLGTLVGSLFVLSTHAATITGAPPTSSTGTFTLSWPSGYYLRTTNGSWQFNGSPQAFTNLPSGAYTFALYTCWQIVEPGSPTITKCAMDPASQATVTVTRDSEVPIDTTTGAAGTTSYSASVSLRGAAKIQVPIRTLPGINGLAPALSLVYDSDRKGDVTDFYTADDTLGYGWNLQGASVLTRCRGGLSGNPKPLLDTTDRLCLDGQPLLMVAGSSYWALNAEYRTEQQSFVKVINKGASGFEVRYPDGRIANFGDTADSQVIASGKIVAINTFAGPSPIYLWAIRRVTNGFGDTMTYAYDRFDPYGMVQLKSITHGSATVELKYGPRSDLINVVIGATPNGGRIWRQAYLHTIRMRMNGTAVREYRLDSNLVGGYLRLEKIQECGYDTAGTSATCLKPLAVGWSAIAGAASPISVTSFTDGLGRANEFVFAAITTTSNPTTYSEAPFGATIAVPNTGPRAITVVTQMKRSDGLTTAGRRSTVYSYKGLATASTLNRGFAGFFEVRAVDQQSGIYRYTQTRLDSPFAGAVSGVRALTAAYGSGTELVREEYAYTVKAQTGGVQYPYGLRATKWVLEGGVVVGGSEQVNTPCFRTLSGDTCPATGTEFEFVSQASATTTTGTGISNPSFTPTFWGAVPDRAISGVEFTTTQIANMQNTSSPWVVGAIAKAIQTSTAASESARTITQTFTYKSGSLEPLTANRFPGDPLLNAQVTRTFTGNNLTSETLSGSGFTSRTISYDGNYVFDLLPPSITNPLNQTTHLDYDLRFGAVSDVTDPDSNIVATEYDAFGRVSSVTRPDGTETVTTYERCDMVDCSAVTTGAVAAMKITTTVSNAGVTVSPTIAVYVDVLGREVIKSTLGLSASHRVVRTAYDNRGRVKYVSRPYFATQGAATCTAAGPNCTWLSYDNLDRVTREDRPDGGFTTTSYSGAAGTITATVTETIKQSGSSDVTRVKRSTFNVLAQLTPTTDAYGTSNEVTTTYDYDSLGHLDDVKVNGVQIATMIYDLTGNRTQLTDANLGSSWHFEYDALRNQTRMVDAKSQDTRYSYDLLDRLTQRIDRFGVAGTVTNDWTWDAPYATGQLESRSSSLGFTETYGYQASDGKLTSIATNINVPSVFSGSYSRSMGYDVNGRLSTVAYPNATYSYAYNTRGYRTQLKSGSTVLEDLQDTDAYGNESVTAFNNGLKTIKGYDAATGRLTSIQTGTTATPKNIQDLEYRWRTDSSLYQRIDHRNTTATTDNYSDSFVYDAVGRVTSQETITQVLGLAIDLWASFTYSVYGNLTHKTDGRAMDYQYTASGKPHRLTSVTIGDIANTLTYDANGSITTYDAASGNDTFLTYDGQNNVTSITVGTTSGTPTPSARDEFWYDPDGNRFLRRQSWDESGAQKQSYTAYLGNFEEVVPATGGSFNLIQRTELSPTVRQLRTRTTGGVYASRFEYVYRDHLGSLDKITDSAGTVLQILSHDPFGGRRSSVWISQTDPVTNILTWDDQRTYRGFTGHEQLNRTGFIHMNGRVYDPRISRFVSADPIVQSPTNSQSYNRYAYVFNNPLSFTDPTGFAIPHQGNKLIESNTENPSGVPTIMASGREDSNGNGNYTFTAPGLNSASDGYASTFNVQGGGGGSGSVNDPQKGGRGGPSKDDDKPSTAVSEGESEGSCVNLGQLGAGATSVFFGGLQAGEGTTSVIVGVAAVPLPGVNVASPPLIMFGGMNMAWGYASMRDGIGMMQSAFDHAYRASTFEGLGQAIGGDRGAAVGKMATTFGGFLMLSKSAATAVNQINTYAGNAAAIDSAAYSVGVVSESTECH